MQAAQSAHWKSPSFYGCSQVASKMPIKGPRPWKLQKASWRLWLCWCYASPHNKTSTTSNIIWGTWVHEISVGTHCTPALSPRVTGLWITLFHHSLTSKGFRRRKASSIHRSFTLFWIGVPGGMDSLTMSVHGGLLSLSPRMFVYLYVGLSMCVLKFSYTWQNPAALSF